MKPYYSDDSATVYNADARDLLSSILRSDDLLVLDPPFDLWSEVPRVAVPAGVIAFTSARHRRHVEALFGEPRAELIWHFDDGRWISHRLPRITHETILVYGEPGEVYVGEQTDGITRNKGSGSVGRDSYATRTYTPRDRKALDSVQHFPRDVNGELGLWSKPYGLMFRLLEWIGGEGRIVDPYLGTATTLRAAKDLGRPAVGIEVSEEICGIAARRLAQEVMV